jgi:hypothetical protein
LSTIPQVVLFGSIHGEWRERHVIPVLTELGVTYYNPVQPLGWSQKAGDIEAEYMAGCETVVMVFNKTLPTFAGLAETGWAALGCMERRQHFIVQIDLDYVLRLPSAIAAIPARNIRERPARLGNPQPIFGPSTRLKAQQFATASRRGCTCCWGQTSRDLCLAEGKIDRAIGR